MVKNRRLFIKFLMSYMLLITVIFSTIGVYSYTQIRSTWEAKELEEAESVLRIQKNYVDKQILDISSTFFPIYHNTSLSLVERSSRPYESEDYILFRELSDELSFYSLSNEDFESITLYVKSQELFISNYSVGVKPEVFYNTQFDFESKPYSDWKNEVSDENRMKLVSDYVIGNANANFRLISDMPYGRNTNDVTLILGIDADFFVGRVLEFAELFGSHLYVINRDGDTLYSNTGDLLNSNLDKEGGYHSQDNEFIRITETSETLDLSYVWYIPRDVLFEKTQQVKQLIFSLYLLIIVISLLISVFMALKNVDPIRKLVRMINDVQGNADFSGANEYDYLKNAFSNVINQNESLSIEMSNHISRLKESFVLKLLNGIFISQREIGVAQKYLSELFSSSHYVVATLQIQGGGTYDSEVMSMIQFITMSMIEPKMTSNIYLHKVDFNRIALIICLSGDYERDQIVKMINDISGKLLSETTFSTVWGVGNAYDICDKLCLSYENSCKVLDNIDRYGLEKSDHILFYEDLKIQDEGYYYPAFAEQQIINRVRNGEIDSSKELLEQLFKENFITSKLTDREKSRFINVLSSTFLQLMKSLSPISKLHEDEYEFISLQIRNNPHYSSNLGFFMNIIDLLSEYSVSNNEDKSNEIVERILEEIEENYDDPEFNLGTIANNMNYTENYLSIIFKKHTNEKISQRIEETRMNAALNLVVGSDMLVKDIANNVGYLNLNTFYKAYKRKFGVTPSEYRKNNKN